MIHFLLKLSMLINSLSLLLYSFRRQKSIITSEILPLMSSAFDFTLSYSDYACELLFLIGGREKRKERGFGIDCFFKSNGRALIFQTFLFKISEN